MSLIRCCCCRGSFGWAESFSSPLYWRLLFPPGVLPSRQLTGAVVSRSSAILHGTGLTCGIVFLITSLVDSHVITGLAVPFALRNVIVFTMIALTVLSMYSVSTRMSALRQDMGVHRRRLPR